MYKQEFFENITTPIKFDWLEYLKTFRTTVENEN